MSSSVDTSYDDVVTTFLELESMHSLCDLRVDGVPVWERIRYDVQRAALDQVFGTVSTVGDSRRTLLSRARDVGASIGTKNPYLKQPCDVLVYGHNRRQPREDGYFWEIYTDPIYEHLDLDYLHLEVPHKGRHYRPARTENLAFLDVVRSVGSMRRRIGRPANTVPQDVARALGAVETRLREEFEVDVAVRDRARRSLQQRASTLGLYEKLLQRQDPSVVVVIVSYGKETFIEACRRANIPVLELQHGVITPYHLGYAYPDECRKVVTPDRLLTFGEFWNETVPFPADTSLAAVGYPFLESVYAQHADRSTENRVTFVSQNTHVGKPLTRTAVELATETDTDVSVTYKLHPEEYVDWEERYPWLQDSPVSIRGPDGTSMYELFGTSRAVVGVYSTGLYEALKFQLPVYVLREPGVAYVEPLLDAGAATAVDSATDLAAELRAGSGPAVESERFFEPDPLANIETVFRDYLKP